MKKENVSTYGYGWRLECVLFRDSAEHLKGNLHICGFQQFDTIAGSRYVCSIRSKETIQPR